MTLYQRVRVWYYRARGKRRVAGGIQAAQTRRENKRFVERSQRADNPPNVVICDEVAK